MNLFKNSQSKQKIAILLTDGMDNINNIPLDVAINEAKKYNVKAVLVASMYGNPANLVEIEKFCKANKKGKRN